MIITILFLTILAFLTYNYYVHHTRYGRLIDLIPGPPYIPVLGNLLEYQTSPQNVWNLLRTESATHYPIYKLWGPFIPMVFIRHPDDLEIILSSTKHIDKGHIYWVLQSWFNTGLLTSTGAKWHARRKILTPAFHFNILRHFINILIEEGDHMTKSLKNTKEQPVVKDLVPFISEHTLNAICETAMGTSLRDLGEYQQEYRHTVHQMGKILLHRFVRPWLYLKHMYMLSPTGRQERKYLQILHGFTEKIIKERKLYHKCTNNRYLKCLENDNMEINDTEVIGIRKKRLAMLDLLIAVSQKNNMSDLDIREEVDTFMFEGHDTTAMGISFALLLLAEHKDIQDRVRAEINTVMQEFGEKFTMTSLQNLSYLDRCLKEVLRLYPSVHFISRIVAEDVQLHSYIVPSGTNVNLNIYDVHRDPNFWPNPDVFDPDRFIPENMSNRHIYSYIPFSAGPRNCIGQRYAMLEMKAMIASLVRNFYLEPVDYLKDICFTTDLVLRPAHPVRLKFVPI